MPFRNPIVAGLTLIRAAIKSPNYVAGVSGWTVKRDGSAEFNDVTVRGDLIVGQPPTGSGFEIIGASAMPAELIAHYPTATAALIQYYSSSRYTYYVITPTVYAFGTWDGSFIFEQYKVAGTNSNIVFNGDTVFFQSDATFEATARVTGSLSIGDGITPGVSLDIDALSAFTIAGVSQPRGTLYAVTLNAATIATITASTESVVLTTPSLTFKANRAYEIVYIGEGVGSAANVIGIFRLRRGNTTGGSSRIQAKKVYSTNAETYAFTKTLIVGGVDVTQQMCLCLSANAAGNLTLQGTGDQTLQFYIRDIGSASGYPSYSTV